MGHSSNKKVSKKQQQSNNFVDLYQFAYEALASLVSPAKTKSGKRRKCYPVYRNK